MGYSLIDVVYRLDNYGWLSLAFIRDWRVVNGLSFDSVLVPAL